MYFNKRMLINVIICSLMSSCYGLSYANNNDKVDVTTKSDDKVVVFPEKLENNEHQSKGNNSTESSAQKEETTEIKDQENLNVPHVILNIPKELSEKPVFYRVNCCDSLSKISEKLLEDPCGWNIIANLENNRGRIGKNYLIKEGINLYIPQPNHNRFRLYNPRPEDTWISISRKFYGSYLWAPYLIKYNDSWGDKPSPYSNCVIKLPSELYFGDYIMPSRVSGNFDTFYSQSSFYSLSLLLFGTDEYAKEIADFNNISVDRPLTYQQLIHIPPSITARQIRI